MVEGVQHPEVAGVAFVGYHTGAGAEGVLAHTYLANSITGVWVDGVAASEGYLNSLVAADTAFAMIRTFKTVTTVTAAAVEATYG